MEVYNLFKEYGLFDYLKDGYDVLHTQGQDYIINDIEIYLLLFTAISKKIKKITKNVIFLLTFIVYCGIIIYIESEGYNVRNY